MRLTTPTTNAAAVKCDTSHRRNSSGRVPHRQGQPCRGCCCVTHGQGRGYVADKEIGLVEVALEATMLRVRPPRGRVEFGTVPPQAALRHGYACMGLQARSLHEALLSPKASLLQAIHIKPRGGCAEAAGAKKEARLAPRFPCVRPEPDGATCYCRFIYFITLTAVLSLNFKIYKPLAKS